MDFGDHASRPLTDTCWKASMHTIDDIKAKAIAAIDRIAPALWAASLDIHAHPELGYAEVHAARVLTDLLWDAGVIVELGVAGMPTAFRAHIPGRTNRPAIALLAEMDALPEIGHGCGHNLIGSSAVGAGLGLAEVAAELPGAIVILGCPAEETAVDDSGGKLKLIAAGMFDDIDAALMVHPGTLDMVSTAGSLASCGYEFAFRGRAAHAALAPEEGINALDAVLLTFQGVNALRQHVRPDVRMHGIITAGGSSPNVVPEHAACRFRMRAADARYLSQVAERVLNCARAGSLATGAELSVREYAPGYAETRPNETLAQAFAENLTGLGRLVQVHSSLERKASTDFGNVSQVMPAIAATVAIAEDGVWFHTPEFAAAAASGTARTMLIDSAKGLALTAIDLLIRPGLLQAATAEFYARRR
jgi:amidohydrolase